MVRRVAHQIHRSHVAAAGPRPAHAQTVRPAVSLSAGHGAQKLGDAAGVQIIPDAVNGATITQGQMDTVVAALEQLPPADIALVAAHHVAIHLDPVSGLQGGLLGATTVLKSAAGTWYPTVIHVAADAGLSGVDSLGEIVQHEFGHAVSVLRHQDRSEAAAIKYAASH
jgi:hypothetical protein